jgi:hypothetical protein
MAITNTTKQQLHDGNSAGLQIGRDANDKVAFFGSDPVVQQATIADATNTTTTTSTTTALTTDLDSLRSKFNSLLSKLESLGLLASA